MEWCPKLVRDPVSSLLLPPKPGHLERELCSIELVEKWAEMTRNSVD